MTYKIFLSVICGSLLIISCGRSTIPSKTQAPASKPVQRPPIAPDRPKEEKNYIQKATVEIEEVQGNNDVTANNETNAKKTAKAEDKALAILDGKGNIVITPELLPFPLSQNLEILKKSVRAYTPNQAKNLANRYNFIPPRVIYVPESLQRQGTRGVYFLYKNQENILWYWKRKDGYFYIDENHYE